MKNERTKAIVLRRTNYGEADRIIQFITPEGRRSVMAKGVRKEKSRLAGGVELFTVCDVVIGRGKGELGILTSSRLIHSFHGILKDYDRMQLGYEVIKQVARASEMVDEPEWYDVLEEILAALDSATIDRHLIETWFYLRHATLLGHELNLQLDLTGRKLVADEAYSYDVSERGLRSVARGELTADHIKLLRLINVKPLRILAQIGGIDGIITECFHVARAHAAV